MSGWIIEVENEDGGLLYAVRIEDPILAEDFVRLTLGISSNKNVCAIKRVKNAVLDKLNVEIGGIKGPI